MQLQLLAESYAAHPRSRGENLPQIASLIPTVGSSPLTRGKQGEKCTLTLAARLIPAHAGKTVASAHMCVDQEAHPRSRGENPSASRAGLLRPGSSPLTRGKRSLHLQPRNPGRLIPAHAGKTADAATAQGLDWAHPRSRGENQIQVLKAHLGDGSSPLTRGKHFLTCAFTAQIDQILESLELAASSGSYSIWVACATDAPQDQVQSIGLVLPNSRDAS